MKLQRLEHQRIQQNEDLLNKRRSTSKANHKSDRLIVNARRNKFSLIFDRLDEDKNGEISSGKVYLKEQTNLSGELFGILKPLLSEIEIL